MTDDLEDDDPLEGTEGAGLARIARPSPASPIPPVTLRGVNAPTASPAPDPGSTEAPESRGLASHITPRSIAAPSPLATKTSADQGELGRLESTGSGISQIKSPVRRGILRGLSTIGSIAGSLIPGVRPALMSIPGTEEHHNFLIRQQQGKIGEDLGEQDKEAGTAKTQADTEEAGARTGLAEAQTAAVPETAAAKTTTANAAEKNADTRANPSTVAKNPLQLYTDAVREALAAGRDPETDPKVQQLADTITSIQKPTAAPGEKAVTIQLPGGQKVAGKVDRQGNLLTADNKPVPQGAMLYQAPNYGQMVLPTKTIQVIGADGVPTIMRWNPETEAYDIPAGGGASSTSATGAYGHEMAQAGAVQRGGEQLIADIQANKDKLGDLSAWVKKYGLNTPIADPDLASLQAELKTFAALQPAMHGFRSRSAQEAFENIIGDVQKNPEATIASIRAILKTSGAINPGLDQEPTTGGAKLKPPKEADSGMKWQHREINGKTEWRQVPIKTQ